MHENLELDPLFDASINAKTKRFIKKVLGTRYLLVALLIHALILIVFGGKVLFEAYQRVNLESDALIAPHHGPVSVPLPNVPQEKQFEVKVVIPEGSSARTKLATDKLSTDFNVVTPEIQNTVSISMEGISSGSGSGTGNGSGSGFTNIKFFGISGEANSVIFLIDVSKTMANLNDYSLVEKEFAKVVRGLGDKNRFNVITFASTAYPFKENVVGAEKEAKEEAISWLKKLNPVLYKAENFKNDTVGDIK